jgi:type II secretory ATPase GspE/PulE/Tfp pilus assembly ATPase PilB-like protein
MVKLLSLRGKKIEETGPVAITVDVKDTQVSKAKPVPEKPKEAAPKISIQVVDQELRDELATATESSVVKLVNLFIEHAYHLQASDIHFDPQTDRLRVRLRVDGVLQESHAVPKALNNAFISRIKILSGLRTDEHQAAQDGRFRYTTDVGVNIDVRVSIAPTYHGENAVLRLLADQHEQFTLQSLGLSKSNQEKVDRAIRRPYGMILATGPTGSGKTTTLYTVLKELNTPDVSIVTIEDPVEYAIDGIEQIPVNDRTNLTFSSGLRSILRQDPNVIMVGEVRDGETAGLAVNTALTGHLVLSTLHTNDAATTLPRLLDLGVEPYLIASTVNVAIGQRLVRKICDHCKEVYKPTPAELKSIDHLMPEDLEKTRKFYRGTGCDKCNDTGYRGRVGIHEVMELDKPLREAILAKKSSTVLKEIAIKQGMATMVEDGLEKAAAGITTIDEVLRTQYD